MIPGVTEEHMKYLMAGVGALGLVYEWPNISLAYNTLGRDVEYAYKVGTALRLCNKFQKNNMTIHQLFYNTMTRHPDKVMVFFEDQQWTFRDMEEYSNRISHFFLSQGFKRGDVLAVFMENRPEYIGVLLGLSKIGVTSALINTHLTQTSLTHCITVGASKGVIFDFSLGQAVGDVLGQLKTYRPDFACFSIASPDPFSATPINIPFPDLVDLDRVLLTVSCVPVEKNIRNGVQCADSLCYIFTSGTTGLPKAAYQDHSRFYMGSNMAIYGCGVCSTDRVYTTLPMYHSSAMWMAVGCSFNVGCSIIIRKKFSASNFWTDCVKHQATCAQYIGEICRFLLQTPPCQEETQHKLRMMYGVGLRPQIWKEFVTRFKIPNIRETFGSTEGTYGTINIRSKEGACGFMPRIINYNPFGLIKVDQETGEVVRGKGGLCVSCKPGEQGEMVGLVRSGDRGGPGRFKAYVDKEDPNKGKIIRDVWRKGDMCFRSGDLLTMDNHGWLYFEDRKGDTFRWRGENVSTAEVEAVISNILGHTSAVVYGVEVPGAEGRAGMAAILQDSGDEDGDGGDLGGEGGDGHGGKAEVDLVELATGLRKSLPSYARPMFVRIIKKLQLTGTYKLKKTELQSEGFDVTRIEDDLFFMGPKDENYRKLDLNSYHNLMTNLQSSKL